jgi:hypothetical protein
MRLITRKQFLELPEDTEVLYSQYHPIVFEGWSIKTGNTGRNDWCYTRLQPDDIANRGSDDHCDKLFNAERLVLDPNQPELPMDFDCGERDGLYEADNTLIAVYSEADVLAMAERLVRLLPNHRLIDADGNDVPRPPIDVD